MTKNTKLSAPWETYRKMLEGFFDFDEDVIVNKSKSLIIPYIVFGTLHIGLMSVRSFERLSRYLYSLLLYNTADEGIPIAGAIWFLTALFFADVIYSV